MTGEQELELYEFMRKESFETGLPMAEIVRRGITLYKTQKEEKEVLTYEVLEDSGGGLYLAVFKGDECVYFSGGFEHEHNGLIACLDLLEAGEGTEGWETDLSELEAYSELANAEHGLEVVAENGKVYPERMGGAAQKILFVKIRAKAREKIDGNNYVRLISKARQAATNGGIFTDNESEWDQNSQYLVTDMADIIQAYCDDYSVEETFGFNPAEADDGAEAFCKRHGIEILG